MIAPIRLLLLALGLLSLSLGVAGAFLPLLPTTPFLLLAAFCFARSSSRWHQWLLQHRHLGRFIKDWQESGAIPLYAKCVASLCLLISLLFILYKFSLNWMSIGTICFMLGVLVFIWSRPSSKV